MSINKSCLYLKRIANCFHLCHFFISRSYHIIIIEGNGTSQVKHPDNFSPSDLGPYDSSTYVPGKAYVTGVLSSFTSKFEIGNGKEYSVSTRRRRNVGGQKYNNVPLKQNTEYMVFQRAYVSQVFLVLLQHLFPASLYGAIAPRLFIFIMYY